MEHRVAKPQKRSADRSEGRDAAHQCSKQTTGSCGSFGPAISVVCLLH